MKTIDNGWQEKNIYSEPNVVRSVWVRYRYVTDEAEGDVDFRGEILQADGTWREFTPYEQFADSDLHDEPFEVKS